MQKFYIKPPLQSFLMHYGTPRESGRYKYGSGENPYQHPYIPRDNYDPAKDFYAQYLRQKSNGMSDNDIAKWMGMNTTEFRQRRSIAKEAELNEKRIQCRRLKEHGYSDSEIARKMDTSPSNIRNWLKEYSDEKKIKTSNTADILQKAVDEKGIIDIGAGVEAEMNISREKLKTAVKMLKDKGYVVHNIQVEQATNPGKFTTVQVLAPEGTTVSDVYNNLENIQSVKEYTTNEGLDWKGVKFPQSISSDRVYIRYNEDGGELKDGVIELRRNVPDLSLGENSYAQVRIAVDDKQFLKGMAIYTDDIPDGYDVIFNTNKHNGTPKEKVFKDFKTDNPDNPFGATIKAKGQYTYLDEDGKEKLGAINIVKDEGDVENYSKSLSSQFLSKQNLPLIKRQLNLAYSEKLSEYDDIMSVDNPTIRAKLLADFAENCDAGASELKAAALPRQSSKFILPCQSLKDNEVYAPTYKDGESVVLIRYPHAGTFEIPELVVNNRNKEAKSLYFNAKDAIAINSSVAQKLSGADFDGDTVLVIPVNDKVKIKTSPTLESLKDFSPSEAYPGYPGMKKMTSREKGIEMGSVSNLITDMQLKGAPIEHVARAVKHSMVVIDAEKHGLDWKASERDNGIAALKELYQGGARKGASTLISKASSEARIDEVKKKGWKPNEEGEWEYEETGNLYFKPKKYTKDTVDKVTGEIHKKGDIKKDENGAPIYEEKKRQTKTTKMALVKDAYELSSGTPVENAYADFANKLKALANTSRKSQLACKPKPVSNSAKELYSAEVSSLKAKLNRAILNSPRERRAQLVTRQEVRTAVRAANEAGNPLDKEHTGKLGQQRLAANRIKFGAGKKDVQIQITEKEWEAINAGAISSNQLSKIIQNTDSDKLKKLAMPRETRTVSDAKMARMKALNQSGYTIAEIAEQTGFSASTVSNVLKPPKKGED